jgi:branched-subunit amino acid ABC-type transport system permease component
MIIFLTIWIIFGIIGFMLGALPDFEDDNQNIKVKHLPWLLLFILIAPIGFGIGVWWFFKHSKAGGSIRKNWEEFKERDIIKYD